MLIGRGRLSHLVRPPALDPILSQLLITISPPVIPSLHYKINHHFSSAFNQATISNWHHISLLPFISRLLEHAAYYRCLAFLSSNSFLDPPQSDCHLMHYTWNSPHQDRWLLPLSQIQRPLPATLAAFDAFDHSSSLPHSWLRCPRFCLCLVFILSFQVHILMSPLKESDSQLSP